MGFYFNRIYNPVYDFVVGQIAPYHRLQEECIDKLELADGDELLCAGIGTGNEVVRILDHTHKVRITGIDSSSTALKKAAAKARKRGHTIETRLMDVQDIGFPEGTFDKAICIHVTDFVKDSGKVSAELLRVLKHSGRFVVTFPSNKESASMGLAVLHESACNHLKNRKYYLLLLLPLSFMLGALVYLPLLLRRERRKYSKDELNAVFRNLAVKKFTIEDFPVYNDYMISGEK